MLPDNQEKLKVARLSIFSNTVLIISKLAVGLFTGSISVLSEALHSGMDLLASFIAYFSVRAAAVPPDKEHQFGHGKIENLSGSIEAILIFLAALLIIHEAINKIVYGSSIEFVWLGMIVMVLSVVLNWVVSRKLIATAKKYHSMALEADALHLTTDIYTSLGVIIGLGLIQLTHRTIMDPIFAILVATLIIFEAYRLTKKAVHDLCDTKLTDDEETAIRRVLETHSSQFVSYHAMRTRRSGNTRFIDLHLILKKKVRVSDGHQLTDHLEKDLTQLFPNAQVLIHIEPCDDKCSTCKHESVCERKSSKPAENPAPTDPPA